MNDKERDAIMRKIRGCLARADGERNGNEHERAIALRQANALMDKYSISMLELGDGDELGPRGEDRADIGMSIWRKDVYFALAPLYGCECLSSRDGEMYIIGRQHYRTVVLDMAQYVMNSVNTEAAKTPGNKSFKTAFRKGAARAVERNVDEIIAQRAKPSEVPGVGTSMVLVDHYKNELALNDAWAMDKYPNRGRATKRPGIKSWDGYQAGLDHGAKIGLSDQIGGGSRSGQGKLS